MAHPDDIGTTSRIELSLSGEDRQNPIGEIEQLRGAAISKPPGPLLGSDVVNDRKIRPLTAQPSTETHIGTDVIDQNDPIRWITVKQTIHMSLKFQSGNDQGYRFPEADGSHGRGVSDELSPGRFHARSSQCNQFQ